MAGIPRKSSNPHRLRRQLRAKKYKPKPRRTKQYTEDEVNDARTALFVTEVQLKHERETGKNPILLDTLERRKRTLHSTVGSVSNHVVEPAGVTIDSVLPKKMFSNRLGVEVVLVHRDWVTTFMPPTPVTYTTEEKTRLSEVDDETLLKIHNAKLMYGGHCEFYKMS